MLHCLYIFHKGFSMNTLLICIGLTIIGVFISPLFKSKFNIGNAYGIINALIFIGAGIFYERYILFIKTVTGIIITSLYALQLVIVLATLFVVIVNSRKTAKDEKIIIVLGCRVKGTVPTKALLSRCEAAFEHLTKYPNSIAILSGGQGNDEDITEAECMQRILTSRGINKSRLILEEKSRSTEENLAFSKKIIEDKGISGKVTIVTSEYHLYRSMLIAKKYGIKATGIPAKSVRILRVPYYTREVFGVWKLIILK